MFLLLHALFEDNVWYVWFFRWDDAYIIQNVSEQIQRIPQGNAVFYLVACHYEISDGVKD